MSLALLLLLGAVPLTALIGGPRWAAWRRRRIAARPFPSAWRAILQRRVPYVRRLPADLQLQLKRLIRVFLAEKAFIGCAGQAITDEVRVTIAAQACLLLLNRPGVEPYPRLRQVLVYPGAFVVDRVHQAGAGVLQEQRRVLSGESWSQGQVILSWDDALANAAAPDGGHNVVVHEFAHQLDQEAGAANGAPRMPGPRYATWSRVLGAEFARLRAMASAGEPTVIDGYGASDPAEFFAVATEVFFGRPEALAADAPAVYRELSAFYRVDPRSWQR